MMAKEMQVSSLNRLPQTGAVVFGFYGISPKRHLNAKINV